MRVVTTWLYFDGDQVRGYEGYRARGGYDDEKNPGVAFAWFAGDTSNIPDFSVYKVFRPRSLDPPVHPERDQIRGILDLFVRDADERRFFRIPRDAAVENGDIVDFILHQGIVIERSPPILVTLKGVLTNSNSPLWIGTFVGSAAAWDHPTLLLITVPSGIIAVSSAQGIATALQGGLNRAIKRLFDRS
jgi:hypothetical protein